MSDQLISCLNGMLHSAAGGFRTENELWEFKIDCPTLGKMGNSENAGQTLQLTWRHSITRAAASSYLASPMDSVRRRPCCPRRKEVQRQTRSYLPDTVWVDYHRDHIQSDQRYLGLALIPPRGPMPIAFKSSAPSILGKSKFAKGVFARPEGDSQHDRQEWNTRNGSCKLRNPVVTERGT